MPWLSRERADESKLTKGSESEMPPGLSVEVTPCPKRPTQRIFSKWPNPESYPCSRCSGGTGLVGQGAHPGVAKGNPGAQHRLLVCVCCGTLPGARRRKSHAGLNGIPKMALAGSVSGACDS